jgi:hypothetical protein
MEIQTVEMTQLRAATIEFLVDDLLAQGNLVVDLFVATDSDSPVILATGGRCSSEWASIKHQTTILCRPHSQGGEKGIRARINFVSDQPPRGVKCQLTLAQVGAQKFSPPEKTTPAP